VSLECDGFSDLERGVGEMLANHFLAHRPQRLGALGVQRVKTNSLDVLVAGLERD